MGEPRYTFPHYKEKNETNSMECIQPHSGKFFRKPPSGGKCSPDKLERYTFNLHALMVVD
jgi:hypothetical protein